MATSNSLESVPTGRYVLGDVIGRGGMAEVFAGHAHGSHGFQKPVAIKRLLPELANDTVFVERLIAEAKLLVGMLHSNVVSVLDLAREGSDVFLVMEFVDGPSLRQLLKARAPRVLSLGIATYIVQAAANGLAFAHARRGGAIIHADVSPSNLLLTSSGEVRVADFGIARPEGGGAGFIEGKWAYMAPEQVRGEPLTPRCDVFSLGVVLYELITGQHPLGSRVTFAERGINALPIVPPRIVNPQVPAMLDALCMRALATRPADRFARMQDLSDALLDQRFANGWREGATELAHAIHEVPRVRVTETTQLTAGPATILTSSLIGREPLAGSGDPRSACAAPPVTRAQTPRSRTRVASPTPWRPLGASAAMATATATAGAALAKTGHAATAMPATRPVGSHELAALLRASNPGKPLPAARSVEPLPMVWCAVQPQVGPITRLAEPPRVSGPLARGSAPSISPTHHDDNDDDDNEPTVHAKTGTPLGMSFDPKRAAVPRHRASSESDVAALVAALVAEPAARPCEVPDLFASDAAIVTGRRNRRVRWLMIACPVVISLIAGFAIVAADPAPDRARSHEPVGTHVDETIVPAAVPGAEPAPVVAAEPAPVAAAEPAAEPAPVAAGEPAPVAAAEPAPVAAAEPAPAAAVDASAPAAEASAPVAELVLARAVASPAASAVEPTSSAIERPRWSRGAAPRRVRRPAPRRPTPAVTSMADSSPRCVLRVETDDGGVARVTLDGERKEAPGAKFRRPPGRYTVVLEDDVGSKRRCTVSLVEGRTRTLTVSMHDGACRLQ